MACRDVTLMIQAAADKANAALQRLGFREHTVTLKLIERAGKDPVTGKVGTPAAFTFPVEPRPEVQNVSVSRVQASAGVLQVGDVLVTKLTRNVAFEDLIKDPSAVWEIGGPLVNGEFTSIGGTLKLDGERYWTIVLRRMMK
jgi:hypothetical protein